MRYSLHALRGLMALSILIFHYTKWTTATWNPINPFGILGIYGVSIFFVLSGIVLTLSTEKKLRDYSGKKREFWIQFFQRRVLRIYPLLILATLFTLFLDEWNWSKTDIFLNISGLFGFFRPASDIATGAWSIGCELVYYALFPLIWWLIHPNTTKKIAINRWAEQTFLINLSKDDFAGKVFFFVLLFLACIPFSYYAFYGLQPEIEIQNQWALYVRPLNHLLFFLAGIYIGKWKISSYKFGDGAGRELKAILYISPFFLTFVFFATTETPSDLVTGWTRVGLSIASICLCWVVYQMDIHSDSLSHVSKEKASGQFEVAEQAPLRWLGDVSYNLYLLHPILYRIVLAFSKKIDETLPLFFVALIAFIATLVASHWVYYYFEKPILSKGKSSIT